MKTTDYSAEEAIDLIEQSTSKEELRGLFTISEDRKTVRQAYEDRVAALDDIVKQQAQELAAEALAEEQQHEHPDDVSIASLEAAENGDLGVALNALRNYVYHTYYRQGVVDDLPDHVQKIQTFLVDHL